jgi:hypothetical protein
MKLFARLICFLGVVSATPADDRALQEGQCWSFASRAGEEASFLVVRKLEHRGDGDIAHISIFGLNIANPGAPKGYTDQIAHLPITVDSLRASLREKLTRTPSQCDWQEGYKMWKEASAPPFTEPLRDCIRFVEETIAHGRKET